MSSTSVVIGIFCLAALWCAALLVAGAALQDLRDVLAARARLRPLGAGERGVGLLSGEIVHGEGPDGALATRAIAQLGRAKDGEPPTIAYRDVSHESRVHGGVVRVGEARITIASEGARGAVWTDEGAVAASARGEPAAFADAYAASCTARGHARSVVTGLAAGARVFVGGELALREGELVLRAPPRGLLVVAARDPRAHATRQAATAVAFVVGELLVCAACTALALWPPVFGRVSTLGAAACLAFFLGVTPLGVWLRERCSPPSRAPLHGETQGSSTDRR